MTAGCLLASDLQRKKVGSETERQKQRQRNKCNKAILTKNSILRSLNSVLVRKAHCPLSTMFFDLRTKLPPRCGDPVASPRFLCSCGFAPHPYRILSCFSLG